jgi:hypothetical protein
MVLLVDLLKVSQLEALLNELLSHTLDLFLFADHINLLQVHLKTDALEFLTQLVELRSALLVF